jgi:hypothetical protein
MSRSLTIFVLRREKGKSTESMIISFQPAAFRRKPAPGNHGGKCFTTLLYVLSALAYVQACGDYAPTTGKDIDCPKTTACSDLIGQ